MKTKKFSRFLCLFVTIVMVFTMLPKMSITAYAAIEQFNLPTGQTYYFDLSAEKGNIGTINTGYTGSYPYPGVPDQSLHYVPFTYAGTVNAYRLNSNSSGNTGASAAATASDRSLFVADYNISHTKNWNDLNAAGLIFGKTFDTNYKLRSLSAGSWYTGSNENASGTPTNNEWDSILNKSSSGIKNWRNIVSWGQDTMTNGTGYRIERGSSYARSCDYRSVTASSLDIGFRPALEVLNPTALGADGLKAVTLNLNGGTFNSSANPINIVCAGETFKAPSATGLTRPGGNTSTSFVWNTQANGNGTSYAVGASVPKSVTNLYAQWTPAEQFNLPIGGTYYFDLSGEKGNLGTINTAVPDQTLHYVPFTYAGTVNSYSLNSGSSGDINASANAKATDHSLFVSDHNISQSICWSELNTNNLIFGKTFDINYKLRSLSGGREGTGTGDATRGTPTTNEWDSILDKSLDGIKNWNSSYSWAQDTTVNNATCRTDRGGSFARKYNYNGDWDFSSYLGFRPALEVANPGALGTDGLKAVTLNLNGGNLGTDTSVTSMNIICAGGTFKAPSNEGLTRPGGNTGTSFGWNTQANGKGVSYAVGASVPKGVNALYAQWENSVSEGAYYDVVGGTGTGSHLEGSLDVVVTEPTEGITTADKTAGNVSLKLTVAEKTVTDTPDSEKIEGVKQGDTVQYYDVKVEKTVTPSAGNPTTTRLTSIPKPVQAIIPVPQEIQGKTSYTVYRVHTGVAEKIPNDPTAPEFYTVNEGGTSLTLHVNKFSTYAVITGNKALTGDGTLGDVANPINSALDVQGKILEGLLGVYKLDVSWGAMKFDYNASGGVWDPVNHSYTIGGTKGWTNESFEVGNNKITVANHSNGDVKLSYVAKPDAVLAGTTMTVRTTNSLAGDLAVNVLLAKVPTETAVAPTTDTFVWLTGEPTNLATLNGKTYTKAGVITITAEPDKTSGLTPKTTTP